MPHGQNCHRNPAPLLLLLGPLVERKGIKPVNQQEQPTGKLILPGGNTEQEVRQLDRQLGEAITRRNIAALDRIFADDYTHTNPLGETFPKAQVLAGIEFGLLVIESFNTDRVNVRLYGDAAVVTGHATLKGQYHGQDLSGEYRYTRTYVRRPGQWQLVATQFTRIAEWQQGENLKNMSEELEAIFATTKSQLKINERQVRDVTILDMEGNIIVGEGTATLRNKIRRLLEEDHKKILLNFAHVRYVDSSGIGVLLSSLVSVKQRGGQMKLLNIRDSFRELLGVTKLLPVLDVYDNEVKALNDFK